MIFVMKKVCGEHLTATKAVMQRKQTKFRILAYNAYRKAKALFFKDFYEAAAVKPPIRKSPQVTTFNHRYPVVNQLYL